MYRRATGFGCSCERRPPAPGFGGIFADALNVAGSFVGDPLLGSQIASQAPAAFANISETPDQIAQHVLPDVRNSLSTPTAIDASKISPQAQQIGAAIAPQVARALAAQGLALPRGSAGAELQHPSYLDAFGGQNARWVLYGGLALGALLLFKEF